MKRALSFLLILAMVTLCFGGCNGTSSTSSGATDSSGSEKPSGSESQETLEDVTLNVWLMGPGKQADSDMVWEKFNEKLAETMPNTAVNFSIITGDEYLQRYNNMLASGEGVDLAWVGYVTPVMQDINDGNLLPLDDLLNEYGQDILASRGEAVIDMHRAADGKIYYMNAGGSIFGGVQASFVPTDLINDHVGPQWTEEATKVFSDMYHDTNAQTVQAVYDKVAEYLQALKDDGCLYGGFNPRSYIYVFSHRFPYYCRSLERNYLLYVPYNDDTFTVQQAQSSEGMKQYYRTMAEYYQKGYIPADMASREWGNWADNPDGGYDANDPVISAHGAEDDNLAESLSIQYHRDMTVIPFQEEGVLQLTSSAVALPYCCPNPERAVMFVNELYANPELYQMLVYGLEDVHWKDNGDGTVTTLCGEGQATPDWAYGTWKWIIGTDLNAFVTQTDTPGQLEKKFEREKTAYASPLLSFSFDNSSVAEIESALNAIIGEYRLPLIDGYLGADWEATYNEMLDKLNKAGIEQYQAEYQRQIHAFIKERNITSWNYKGQ